jgi:hypothetical protein
MPPFVRPRTLSSATIRGLFLAGFVSLASCSAILGLDELPPKMGPDASLAEASVPTDAALFDGAAEASTDAGGDGAPVDAGPCDPAKLMTDKNHCGECGHVCRTSCSGGVCDADRVADVAGIPRGFFVQGGALYLATLDGANAKVVSCASSSLCPTPKDELVSQADDIRLVNAVADELTIAVTGKNAGPTAIYGCKPGSCLGPTAMVSEPGTVIDVRDVRVAPDKRWIVYTTALNGVFFNTSTSFKQTLSALKNTSLLGSNGSYLFARGTADLQRVALTSPAVGAPMSLPLSDFPGVRQFMWNGGATTLVATQDHLYACSGGDPECANKTDCALTADAPRFTFDAMSIGYVKGGKLTTAPFNGSCAGQVTLGDATPSAPESGQAIGLDGTYAFWVERVGARSVIYRRAR